MSKLRSLDRILSKVEMAFLVLFLGSMVVLAFVQVALRNILGSSFMWADTIVRHLVLWAGFMGAAMATREERHISVDALTKFLSQRTKHAIAVVTGLFAAVVCYFLAGAAWQFLLDEKGSGDEIVLSIPTWVALSVIPLGYGLLTFHFFIRVLDNAIAVVKKPPTAA